ncbi:MAG: PEP-CTERM sorting domain-containing protein [Verrucomicrobiales bacterium]|nr:PEP-CTERM sorting domain-containing protein [Verrucomicrobiales bacterium]
MLSANGLRLEIFVSSSGGYQDIEVFFPFDSAGCCVNFRDMNLLLTSGELACERWDFKPARQQVSRFVLRSVGRAQARATGVLALAAFLLSAGQSAFGAVGVNLTLVNDTATRKGYSYTLGRPLDGTWQIGTATGILAGGTVASGGLAAVTYPIHITQYDSQPVNWDRVAFCVELSEPITFGTSYTSYATVDDIAVLSVPDAPANAKVAGIDAGGIGSVKAAYLQILFDLYYKGMGVGDWTDLEAGAFQLAVWKLTHEAISGGALLKQNLDLVGSDGSTGHFGWYGTDPAAPLPAYSTNPLDNVDTSANVYNRAQGYVNEVITLYNASYDPGTYTRTWSLMGLVNEGEPPFNSHKQDLITVYGPVPEPTTWALIGSVGLLGFAGIRRRRLAGARR